MTAIARGYFGVAVYHPKTAVNIGTLWRSATIYGAAFLATVGRATNGRPRTPRRVPCTLLYITTPTLTI